MPQLSLFPLMGMALILSAAPGSAASFKLRGVVPVSCAASIKASEAASDSLKLVVSEDCNTFYELRFSFDTGSGVTEVLVNGEAFAVSSDAVSIPRGPFAGNRIGTDVIVRFANAESVSNLQTLRLEAVT